MTELYKFPYLESSLQRETFKDPTMAHTQKFTASPHSPFRGNVEYFSNGVIRGWAIDLRPEHAPASIHILVDRQEVALIKCDISREDVRGSFGVEQDLLGFSYILPDIFYDQKPHLISLRFTDRSTLPFPDKKDPHQLLENGIFSGYITPEYRSFVDGVDGDILRGWAVKRATPHEKWEGNLIIEAHVDGRRLDLIRADFYRSDVAQSLECDPACGFEIILPQKLRDQYLHKFTLKIVPEGEELEGSPLTTSLVDDALESKLLTFEKIIGDMYLQLTSIRREIHKLIPQRPFNLRHYHQWSKEYYLSLRECTAQAHLTNPLKEKPLISLICPVWRPLKQDLESALLSVLSQTYPNWELILIDDGGKSEQITTLITYYTQLDPRIKSFPLTQNQGISGATNHGLQQAQGAYIGFLDHDDMLVDVALEIMMRAAQVKKAKILYSDEDKVDSSGHFSAPNFKPDYNYRYLLGCNYICHFTMIEASLLKKVNMLNPAYDGAQDHDFILRLIEHVKEEEIYHVPALLYHWRKTENSTASSIGNKHYAIEAGIGCVSEHLKRQQRPAKVSSIDKMSLYRQEWTIKTRPSVSIIIPFRDQIETTKTCISSLLENLDYPNYEIILVDNFSIEPETQAYLKLLETNPKIKILHIEERFNFSRLNNLAAEKSKSDFLFFLNNDVFIEQKDFLALMVKEALSLPKIAIVGAALLYPNNTIQHAGVAVGPEVIGVHTHRGQSYKDYGYIGRIRLNHEVTAVTGAALLIKKEIFTELGMFDEEQLPIAYNDVDLCLKAKKAGWKILYCAEAVAFHHESLSRGSDDKPEHEERFFHETETMKKRWENEKFFQNDPHYPHYFTLERQTFFDLHKPETLCYKLKEIF